MQYPRYGYRRIRDPYLKLADEYDCKSQSAQSAGL